MRYAGLRDFCYRECVEDTHESRDPRAPLCAWLGLAAASLFLPARSHAQDRPPRYPAKPIRILIGNF